MSDQPRPDRLFRYFPSKASDFFAAKKLWFSALRDYNDPFDALPRFDAMLESQKQREIMKAYAFLPPGVPCDYKSFKREMDPGASDPYSDAPEAVANKYRELVSYFIRVVCFSEKSDDLLMWAHYAESHKGFVVEFHPRHRLFADDEFGPVDYQDQRPQVEDRHQGEEELGRMLFRKSRVDWGYEEEWRFVKSVNTLLLGKRRDGREKHYLDFPPDLVKAVYFGHCTPTDTRDEILRSLQSDEWKDVTKSVMCLDAAKYALKPVSWDEWQRRPRQFAKELDALTKNRA
jgi:Protein of unknown function (DUF2971)